MKDMKGPILKSLLIVSCLCFLCLRVFPQEFETESVLLRKQVQVEDYYEAVETLLTGEEARSFNWKLYKEEPIEIVIRRKRIRKIKDIDREKAGRTPSLEVFLSEVAKVYMIDEAGDEKIYRKRERDWMDDEEMGESHFRLVEGPDTEFLHRGLPNVYLQVSPGQFMGNPVLYWMDSGECPDEAAENQLREGELRISFQDKSGITLFRRTIITTLIPLEEWQEVRIVEIEDERYIR